MAESKGYNLGTGYVNATISFDGIGREIAQQMRKVTPKAGQEAGQRIGRGLREGVEKEAAKVDLSAYEAQVKSAEDRVAKTVAAGAEKQAAARRKVEIAEAKLAETREKYKADSSQVLAAEDRLADARKRLAREAYDAARAQDKLNEELSDARGALADAREGAEKTADAYKRSFGPRFVRRIHESLREAVSSQTAVVAAGVNGATAGAVWGQGFKRALGGQNLAGFTGSMLAGLSGARTLSDIGGGFRDFITNLDRSVPRIGAVSVALMTLGGAGIAAVGGLLGVVNSLGSIAAAGLTLPGLIGAGAASMAVFTMAMMDATTVLADMGPMFQELQDSVSGAFWDRAAAPIMSLANAVFPILLTRMSEVSHEMGGLAVAVASTMSEALPLAQLEQMFIYLRDAIDVAGDGVGAMTAGLMTLGTVGASYLPALASWFNSVAYSFESWVEQASASGQIFDWIDTGLTNLRALGWTLVHTIGVFHALGQAAQDAGSGGLVGLADAMERANRALHTDEWQAGLRSMFSGARESMALVGDGFGNMARGLLDAGSVLREAMVLSGASVGMLLTSLGALFSSPAVQGGLSGFFNGVHDAVVSLTQSAGPAGEIIGGLLSTMGTIASTLGNVVANAVEAVGPAVATLIEGVRPLIPLLGQIVSAIVDGLAPILRTVAGVVVDVLLPPLIAFAGWLADNAPLVTGVVTVLGVMASTLGVAALAVAGFNKVLGVLRVVMAGVTAVMAMNPFVLIAAAVAGLVVAVVLAYQRIGWFRDAVDAAWAGIKAAFSATIDWITGTAFPALMDGLAWVGDKFAWLWQAAQEGWGWVKGAIAGVVDWFNGTAAPGFGAAIGSVGGFFTGLYTGFVQPVMGWIRGAISNVVDWFTGTIVPNFHRTINELGGFFDALYRNFIAPFVWAFDIAMKAVSAWFRDTVVPIFRAATEAIGNAFRRLNNNVIQPVWTWIQRKIQAVTAWFTNTLVPWFRRSIQFLADKFTAFRNWVGAVWDWVRDKIQAVTSWFANTLVPWFRRAVQSIADKFTWFRNNVINPVWDWVRSKIDGVARWFRDVLVPAFRRAIQWLADKFTNLRDGVRGVWDAIVGKLRDGWNWIDNNVFAKFRAGIDRLKTAFDDAQRGIGAAWDKIKAKVREPIKTVVTTAINPFIDGYNKLNNFWSGTDLDPIKGFARGGVIPGYQAAKKDDRLIPMRSGEGVLVPEAVRGIGADTIHALNHAGNTGGVSAARNAWEGMRKHDHDNLGNAAIGAPVYGGVQSFIGPNFEAIARTGELKIGGNVPGWGLDTAIRMADAATTIKVQRGGNGLDLNSVTARQGYYPAPWDGMYSRDDGGISLNNARAGGFSQKVRTAITAHEIGHALGLPHNARMHGGNGAWSIMNYDNFTQHGSFTAADVAALSAIYGGSGKSMSPGSSSGDDGNVWLDQLKNIVTGPIDKAKSAFKGNKFAQMPLGLADKLVEGVIDKAASLIGLGGGDSGPAGTDKVTKWMAKALKMKGLFSEANLASGVRRAMQESNGDPSAINKWDSNWLAGNPSKGLMQVVQTTFNDHMEKGFGDIWKPLDNILASINYTIARYGSLKAGWDQPGGYALGGIVDTRPFDDKWDDPVGTVHKLSPGVSSIYNGTGGNEFFQRVTPGSSGVHVENMYALDTDDALRKLHRHVKKQEAMYA